MTIARVPSLAHWGAFNALVEGGRVIGCEPFVQNPPPSARLSAIPDMVHSPLRIARPAIRDGWRESQPRTGADSFHDRISHHVICRDAADAIVQKALNAAGASHTEGWVSG